MGHEVERIALQRGHKVLFKIDNEQEWNEQKQKIIEADVAIEFSTPTAAIANINHCFDIDMPVVCGTTAWYQHLNEIKNRCEKENHTLFYAPNFSIGMNIVFMINKQIAKMTEKYDYKFSITETHHIHKLDKPSGTAVKLAEDIIENNKNYNSWKLNSDDAGILPIKAIREGEYFGIHEVAAKSEYDIISLRHEAFSRKGFATGAVIAAEFIQGKKGCFTMNDLLNC